MFGCSVCITSNLTSCMIKTPSWEPDSCSSGQIPFPMNPNVTAIVAHHSHMNPVHILTPYFCKISFNIILLYMLRSRRWSAGSSDSELSEFYCTILNSMSENHRKRLAWLHCHFKSSMIYRLCCLSVYFFNHSVHKSLFYITSLTSLSLHEIMLLHYVNRMNIRRRCLGIENWPMKFVDSRSSSSMNSG